MDEKSNIQIKRCILINAKEKRKKIPININSKSISNQFKSSNHVNLVASSYLSMGQKINSTKNQKISGTSMANIINNIVNYSYNKCHKLYNNSLSEKPKINNSVKNNIYKPCKYINLSNIRKKNLSNITSDKLIYNNYSINNNNSQLKNNLINKHDFLDSRNKTKKIPIKSKIKPIKYLQNNKPKSVSPSNNVNSSNKLLYTNNITSFNQKQIKNIYNHKKKLTNEDLKNKMPKEKLNNSFKKLFIKIKKVSEINERKNQYTMLIKLNKKKIIDKSKIENNNQNYSFKPNKISFPDSCKNSRKFTNAMHNQKNLKIDFSKIIKKTNKNSNENNEINNKIKNGLLNHKKLISANSNSILKITILDQKNNSKNKINTKNYNNLKKIKSNKIPFINNIIINNCKENNNQEKSKNNNEKEKIKSKKIRNGNRKNSKRNKEENLSTSNFRKNNYSSDGIVVDIPLLMEHKVCLSNPIKYIKLESNKTKLNEKIKNNHIIIENDLFNECNLNELSDDCNEQFDDLYSIINKMDFKNVLIGAEGIFSQDGKIYKRYKDIFDKKYDKLFGKKRGSFSNNNNKKIKIGGERGYISNTKTNYSSSGKKKLKSDLLYKEDFNIANNLIIK